MNNRQVLRELLKNERPLVMPDAYDGLSARLIQLAGFKAVQCSGFSMGLASQAAPEQDVDLQRNLAITRDIVRAVTIPVMADGEDGFGPPAVVYETVGAFIDASVERDLAGLDHALPSGQFLVEEGRELLRRVADDLEAVLGRGLGDRARDVNGGDPGAEEPALVCWYELRRAEGRPTWTRHVIDDNSGTGMHFEVVDINGDGLLDIAAANKKGVFYFEQTKP